jgi:methionyl-tRNA synthetase
MKNNAKPLKVLITTPIFYPSGTFHIGGAHTMIFADILARIGRLVGCEVTLLTGLDENTQKVVEHVEKKQGPEQLREKTKNFLENYSKTFRGFCKKIQVDWQIFVRTSDKNHAEQVVNCWKIVENNGYIEPGKYSGFYSVRDETFFRKEDLIDGLAPTGAPVQLLSQPCFLFRADKFREKILEFLDQELIYPTSSRQILKNFIKEELRPLCISRKKTQNSFLGITVPENPEHFVYVWFDALTNYLHSKSTNEDIDRSPEAFGKYWNGFDRIIHLVGKDIAVFHAIFWPAMLMAMGLRVFNQLVVHKWWLSGDKKMSKSHGEIIMPEDILKNYGCAFLRFVIFKHNLVARDRNFDCQEFLGDYNSILVNQFSNLLHRGWVALHRKGFSPEQTQVTYAQENIIKSHFLDGKIDKIFLELQGWTKALNENFSANELWKNIPKLKTHMSEVRRLTDYWLAAVSPSKKINWQEAPEKLFEPLELSCEKNIS